MKITRGGQSLTCSFHDTQHCTSCKKIPMFFCTTMGRNICGMMGESSPSSCHPAQNKSDKELMSTPIQVRWRKANHYPNTGMTSMTFCVQVKIRVNLLKPYLISPGSFSYWDQIPDNLQHSCNCIDKGCLLWLSIFLCTLPKSQNLLPQNPSSLGLQDLSIMKL